MQTLEKHKDSYSDEDKVLYELDKGILAYYAGDKKGTQKSLQRADRLIEENYTKSVGKAILSAVTNDYALPYSGEDYEHVYVNIFKSLTYIDQGDFDGAMVELRRMNEKFKDFSIRYAEEIEKVKSEGIKDTLNTLTAADYPFTDSALGRYLSLMLYRAEGDEGNAMVDKRALLGDVNNDQLMFNSSSRNEHIRTELPADSGIVDILAFVDGGPYKYAWELQALSVGNSIVISGSNPTFNHVVYFKNQQDLSFKFSIPRIAKRDGAIERVAVSVNGIPYTNCYEIENFGDVAVNTFNSSSQLIILKSLLRGIAKAIAANKITEDWDKQKSKKKKKKNGDDDEMTGSQVMASIFSSLTKAAINATEIADLRCWRLLPERADVNQLVLPYGTHEIKLEFIGKNGTIVKTVNKTVTLSESNTLNLVSAYAF